MLIPFCNSLLHMIVNLINPLPIGTNILLDMYSKLDDDVEDVSNVFYATIIGLA